MEPKVIPTDFGKLVLDEMPGGAIVTTADGVVVYWNKGAQSIFGYTVAEALQRRLTELVGTPDHQSKINQSLRNTHEARASVDEILCRKKDGLLVYVNMSCKVLSQNQRQDGYVLITSTDITHIKALRDAKLISTKFGNLLDSIPDGIVIVNSTGRIVLVNTQAEKLFGYSADEIRGQSVEMLLPPASAASIRENAQLTLPIRISEWSPSTGSYTGFARTAPNFQWKSA
jgi:PAS domain S-box-containing protein